MDRTENNQYIVRQSKLIAGVGIFCAVFFLALTILLIAFAKDATEAVLIVSLFLAFILLGLLLAVYALKWRVEVCGDTLTMYHPFKRLNKRSITFDEITLAKNGMNGLYIYAGDKKVLSVDTFAVGRGKLVEQLREQAKFNAGIWQPTTAGEQSSSYAQPESGEFSALTNAVGELDKPIKGANGVVIFLAVFNVLLGVLLTFFSGASIFDEGFFAESGSGFFIILSGLLFLGLSFGFVKRSRVCILIAVCYIVVDAVLVMIDGGFGNGWAFYAMRVAFIIALIAGLRACFRYHTAINEYAKKTGNEKRELLKSFRLKTHKWQITTCIIVGCIGIGITAYGFASGTYIGKRDINKWVEYSSGQVTVVMPTSYIDEYSDTIQGIPGARYLSAMSEDHNSFALLISHKDVLNFFGLTEENANELELLVLEETVYDFGADVINSGTGFFPERVRYYEKHVKLGDEYGAIRCFSRGNDIYIVGVFINANDISFFSSFFEHVVIK